MLHFSYELTGAGWSQATPVDGDRALTMRVSYLSDALRDLTLVTLALVRGAEHVTCYWQDEPGGFEWLFDAGDDTLKLAIRQV